MPVELAECTERGQPFVQSCASGVQAQDRDPSRCMALLQNCGESLCLGDSQGSAGRLPIGCNNSRLTPFNDAAADMQRSVLCDPCQRSTIEQRRDALSWKTCGKNFFLYQIAHQRRAISS